MHYCKRDEDPSLGVRNRAAPGRNLQWTEGEVVRAAKRAWRMGYFGLTAVIAVAWDTDYYNCFVVDYDDKDRPHLRSHAFKRSPTRRNPGASR